MSPPPSATRATTITGAADSSPGPAAAQPGAPGAVSGLTGAAGLLLLLAAARAHAVAGPRQAVLLLIGALAGGILYHAAFGFGGAWRAFIVHRRAGGVRAQMLMLALACVVFFPLLARGHLGGGNLRGFLSPIGPASLLGAFLFGIGMQLGGGCASGTLYTVGGGSVRMLVTLLFFLVGTVSAALHTDFWSAWPRVGPVSLLRPLGPAAGLLASLAAFASIAWLAGTLERRRHGDAVERETRVSWRHLWRGQWPLWWGAVGLALVNVATLLVAGRPWGITGAFVLWGSKLAGVVGLRPETWSLWSGPEKLAQLHGSLLADTTSAMNIGLVVGALLASALAGRFRPSVRVPLPSLAAAVVGGLCLGYGARLAHGCNIGAFFSGIASSSLHGWVWFPMALLGSVVGVRLRPLFRLD